MKRVRQLMPWLVGLLALAVLAVILVRIFNDRDRTTVEVLLPPPVENEASAGSADGEEDRFLSAQVTADTVLSVLRPLSRADSYARELTVETFWEGGSSLETISVWAKGSSLRLVSDKKNLLLADGNYWLWYSDDDRVLTGKTEDSAQADRYQRILTYEDILTGQHQILDAGYTRLDGVPCIYVEYISGAFDYRDQLYISVENGLLIGADTMDGETLVYRMRSGETDISTPSDEVFAPPAGSIISAVG